MPRALSTSRLNPARKQTRCRSAFTASAMIVAALLSSCSVHDAAPEDGIAPSSCVPAPWAGANHPPCGHSSTGPSETGPGSKKRLTSIPTYTHGPKDGSGWSTQPMDQPRPMPSPNYDWFQYELANCAWTTPELLATLGKTGGDLTTGPVFCAFYIDKNFSEDTQQDDHEQMQIEFDGPYTNHFDTIDIAFMHSITIAGLEAREYDLQASQDKYPGSCTVEVNTRSTGGMLVIGSASASAPRGTDPEPMCRRVRGAATVLAKTFVPLAGGTPWRNTPQQPKSTAITDADACAVTANQATAEIVLATEGHKGTDGEATTCIYSNGRRKVTVWLATDMPAEWHAKVPRLDVEELTENTTLGTLPAYRQVTPSGNKCAEAVQVSEGQVLHVVYENRRLKTEELCRVAELIAGSSVNKMTDII
jgi:hypothetical protein